MTFDLRITGGTIVDGTGKPGFVGDLGIKDGKVVALGKAEGAATQTIDATGKIVSPGFVDVHTHYDAQILWDRMLTISPWHGVTTTVIGNCGFGVAPTREIHRKMIMQTLEKVEGMSLESLEAGLGMAWPFETFPQYLDTLEKRGSAINVAALFGHTPLRLYVMGEESTERAATADEISAMKKLMHEAMEAGAIGFGTSVSVSHNGYAGKPVPSRQATPEEMDALVSVMGEIKRGLMQITIGRDFSTRHMAEVSRKYNIPVTWTALLSHLYGPGGHRKQLDLAAVFAVTQKTVGKVAGELDARGQLGVELLHRGRGDRNRVGEGEQRRFDEARDWVEITQILRAQILHAVGARVGGRGTCAVEVRRRCCASKCGASD